MTLIHVTQRMHGLGLVVPIVDSSNMIVSSRKLCTSTFLVIYLSCTLFGESVHLCQCASSTGTQVEATQVETKSQAAEVSQCTSCDCVFHGRQNAGSEDDSPAIPHEHDSHDCSICQALALTEDCDAELVGVKGVEAIPESASQICLAVELVQSRSIRSRGPPAV